MHQSLLKFRLLFSSILLNFNDFLFIPTGKVYNRKLVFYLRLCLVWQSIAFLMLVIWKWYEILSNVLAVLFLPCIWGMTVYYCYQYSLQALKGDDQVRGKIRKFSFVLILVYSQFILIIPCIVLLWVQTSETNWQSPKNIYLGKFHN